MKKRRRSTPAAFCDLPSPAGVLLLDGLFIAISFAAVAVALASLGQRKGLGFQFHEDTAETAAGTVEMGRAGHLQVGEHPRRPRLEMPLEEPRLFGKVSREVAARKAGHDLQQD